MILLFVIFLLIPSFLIPGYDYDEDANLYLIYSVLFVFFIVLTIGINVIVKRYIKRSIEDNVVVQQLPPNKPIEQHLSSNNKKDLKLCSSCGEDILDKTGGFCSKCGAPIK